MENLDFRAKIRAIDLSSLEKNREALLAHKWELEELAEVLRMHTMNVRNKKDLKVSKEILMMAMRHSVDYVIGRINLPAKSCAKSAGMKGLEKAIDGFNYERDFSLSMFYNHCIFHIETQIESRKKERIETVSIKTKEEEMLKHFKPIEQYCLILSEELLDVEPTSQQLENLKNGGLKNSLKSARFNMSILLKTGNRVDADQKAMKEELLSREFEVLTQEEVINNAYEVNARPVAYYGIKVEQLLKRAELTPEELRAYVVYWGLDGKKRSPREIAASLKATYLQAVGLADRAEQKMKEVAKKRSCVSEEENGV